MIPDGSLHDVDVAQALLSRLDRAVPPLFGRHEPGPCDLTSALAVAGIVRQHPVCHVGYTPEFVSRLLAGASGREIALARRVADKCMAWGPNITQHFGLQQDDVSLILGADEPIWDRLAGEFVERFEEWPHVQWGTSQTLCRLLQLAWYHPGCSDRAFMVFLSALALRVEREWLWARTWDDPLLGTRGHNWWLCQFLGFFKSSILFPCIRATRQMRGLTESFLPRQLRTLFDGDGYSRERSVRYQLVTVGVVTDWVMFARHNGIEVSDEAGRLLSAFGALEAALITPDGQLPWFGDVGRLRGAGEASSRLRAWAGLLNQGAYLARAEAVSAQDGRPVTAGHIALCSIGMDLTRQLQSLAPTGPGALDQSMSDAGLFVMRSAWAQDADYLAVDGSSRGEVVSSHGHDGLFHFILYSRGEPMLVDSEAGWQYDSSPEHYRQTAQAHNVATVDGKGHMGLRRVFRFERSVTPVVDDWQTLPDMCYLSTVHEAYAGIGVTGARRKFFYRRGRYWLLLDRFAADRGADAHVYRQHFHFEHMADRWGRSGLISVSPSGAGLLMIPLSEGMEPEPVTACPWPEEGCRNPWVTGYRLDRVGSGIMGVLMVPFANGSPPEVDVRPVGVEADGRVLSPLEATGLAITVDGETDTHVDLHTPWDLPWQANGFSGTGRLFNSGVNLKRKS